MEVELKKSKRGVIIVSVMLLFFAGMVWLGVKSILYFELQYEQEILSALPSYEENHFLTLSQELGRDLDLSAKAYIVWDLETKQILGERNSEMQFPLASLTKLMTVLVASQISTPETEVVISPTALASEGDNGLVVGERWKLSDLIDFTLLASSNDGAQALASLVQSTQPASQPTLFVEAMNKTAQKIGLTQTFYLNETGLDVNEVISGGYGSAKDIALLVDYLLEDYPQLLEISSQDQGIISSDLLAHQVENTNSIVDQLPNLVASKTGFTDLAGGNLAVVFDAGIGHNILVAVLGSTKEERFGDVEKLVWATLEEIFAENQKL